MSPVEIIVLLLLAAGVALAIRRNLRKGMPCECGGSCHCDCAGCKSSGSCPARAPAGGAACELVLDGLHCMNCVKHAKQALDAIPGVSAEVTLDPPRAFVRTDRGVPDAALRAAVEAAGYRVVSITRR